MSWKLLQSRENRQVFEFGGLGPHRISIMPYSNPPVLRSKNLPRWEKGQRNPYPQTDSQPAPCVHVARCYYLYMEQNCIAIYKTKQNCIAIYKTKQNCNPPNIEWNFRILIWLTSSQGGPFIMFRFIIEYTGA
jgi:hypothetical protein